MLLNLLNLYSLIFALFSKIEGMSSDLCDLKPRIIVNLTDISNSTFDINDERLLNISMSCYEEIVFCDVCDNIEETFIVTKLETTTQSVTSTIVPSIYNLTKTPQTPILNILDMDSNNSAISMDFIKYPLAENLEKIEINDEIETTTLDSVSVLKKEMERLRNISGGEEEDSEYSNETTSEILYDYENSRDDYISNSSYSTGIITTNSYIENGRDYSFNYFNTTPYFHENATDIDEIIDTAFTSITETSYEPSSTMSSESTETSISSYSLDNFYTYPEQSSTAVVTDSSYSFTDDFITIPSFKNKSVIYDPTTSIDSIKSTVAYEIANSSLNPYTTTERRPLIKKLNVTSCPELLNRTLVCNGHNITQVFVINNCTIVGKRCYRTICQKIETTLDRNKTNESTADIMYYDEKNRRMYNLTVATKKKLLKLCWETMFGQELVKLTMMDLVS